MSASRSNSSAEVCRANKRDVCPTVELPTRFTDNGSAVWLTRTPSRQLVGKTIVLTTHEPIGQMSEKGGKPTLAPEPSYVRRSFEADSRRRLSA